LQRLGIPFAAEAPGVPEDALPDESPAVRAMRLAAAKAEAVALRHPGAVVIGSDQVCAAGRRVLDKPGTVERACEQLSVLSGKTARFLTAVAIRHWHSGLSLNHLDTVTVRFRPLSRAEITRYVEREQPLDCAGSFKSEALGITLFEAVQSSDPTSLVGLPLIWVAGALRQAGYWLP
jgi:septum formation protein